MNSDKQKLIEFKKLRDQSIEKLSKKQIDKEQFLDLNYNFLLKLDMKPFHIISDMDEALYNYQYYNIYAKRMNNKASEYKFINSKKNKYQYYINKRENFYDLKDKATIKILEFNDFKNVSAYFINIRSKRLYGKLFEINILNYDNVILHSKSEYILNLLKEHGVFDEDYRNSLIDDYVNRAYR